LEVQSTVKTEARDGSSVSLLQDPWGNSKATLHSVMETTHYKHFCSNAD
jgi:hypothetical protein